MPRDDRALSRWKTDHGVSQSGRFQLTVVLGRIYLLDTHTGDMWLRSGDSLTFNEATIHDLPGNKNEEEV